ncbi:MAG: hypothetical protein WB988_15900 [Candidatus Nitrosopolaris sp.]
MVFAPVDPAVKEKVIASYLAGHGRNKIWRELCEQGITASPLLDWSRDIYIVFL